MKNFKTYAQFLTEGKLNEISTKAGLDDIIKGRTSSIEGIKMSKDLAQGMKDWIAGSSYGRKYGKHINKGRIHSVLSVANSWGLERYLDKKAQKEWKELYKSVKESKVNENVEDAAFNLDKIFGDDQESIEVFQDIEDNGTWKDMVDYINNWGDEEMLQRYGIRSTAAVKKLAKKIMAKEVSSTKIDPDDDKAVISFIDKEGKFGPKGAKASVSAWVAKKYGKLDKKNSAYLAWKKMTEGKLTEAKVNERKFTEEERKELAKKGLALPNGSFPIVNIEDLKAAILSYGMAKNRSEAAKWIAKRAKALGAEDLIPDTSDFQKALKEVAMRVPARTIAFDKEDMEDEEEKETAGPSYVSGAIAEADKNWSDKVKTDNELPEGTFTKSAKEVADILKKNSDDLQQAMARLNFYINRGGKGLDKKTRAELEKAKEELRKLY